MTEKAKRVWRIATEHELQALLEAYVDDLDEFAEPIGDMCEDGIIVEICSAIIERRG